MTNKKDWSFVIIRELEDAKPLKFYYDTELGRGVLIVNDMEKIKINNENCEVKSVREGSNPLFLTHSKRGSTCIVTFDIWQEGKGWQYLVTSNCDLGALQELKELFKGEFSKEVDKAYELAKVKKLKDLFKD